jgi:ornithine cyclodeaminase/alanine dehydrogenase-like protein (mu-crystallin family)
VAAGASGTFAHVSATTDAECAIAGADVVLTMVSFAAARQTISAHAFERARLIVAVDYDMCVPAAVASDAALFLVDDVAQFETTRSGPVFAAYPHPDASVGEALLGRAPAARDRGAIFVDHLGVGLADVVFADAIRRRAHEMGAGIELPR